MSKAGLMKKLLYYYKYIASTSSNNDTYANAVLNEYVRGLEETLIDELEGNDRAVTFDEFQEATPYWDDYLKQWIYVTYIDPDLDLFYFVDITTGHNSTTIKQAVAVFEEDRYFKKEV